jgi:hypothetical protein
MDYPWITQGYRMSRFPAEWDLVGVLSSSRVLKMGYPLTAEVPTGSQDICLLGQRTARFALLCHV